MTTLEITTADSEELIENVFGWTLYPDGSLSVDIGSRENTRRWNKGEWGTCRKLEPQEIEEKKQQKELDEARRWIASLEDQIKELWDTCEELHYFIRCMDDDLLEYIADYMGDELPTTRLFAVFKETAVEED